MRMSSFSTISFFILLLLSLWSAVISNDASIQILRLPKDMVGPQFLAFDSTGVFYTGIAGGRILKCFTEPWQRNGKRSFFVVAVNSAYSQLIQECHGLNPPDKCGRPAGIALNEKTGDLYIADAKLGLLVVPHAFGFAKKVVNSVDGKPLMHLNGLDVDPTTGVVYFTSFSSHFAINQMGNGLPASDATGKLFKYDPSTKVGTILMEGLSGSVACTVSSDGSFVLVTEYLKSNIKKYWIKGPKARSSEDFTNSVSEPTGIRRIGSTGNFWVASVDRLAEIAMPDNPFAVKVNSNGEVLQKIFLSDTFGFGLISEVNEFNGSLYFGSPRAQHIEIHKL